MCQGYFSRTLQNNFSQFSLYFGKLETAIFKDLFSVAVSENNYVSNTVETYTNLPVTCLISTKNQDFRQEKRRELVSRLASMLSICLFLPLIPC